MRNKNGETPFHQVISCDSSESIDCLQFLLSAAKVVMVQTTGLPTKDETSETILQNLLSPFSCIQSSYRPKPYCFCKPLLVNHLNTQLNAKTKNQASNRHIFRVLGRLYSLLLWVVFTVSSFGSSLQSPPLWPTLFINFYKSM